MSPEERNRLGSMCVMQIRKYFLENEERLLKDPDFGAYLGENRNRISVWSAYTNFAKRDEDNAYYALRRKFHTKSQQEN